MEVIALILFILVGYLSETSFLHGNILLGSSIAAFFLGIVIKEKLGHRRELLSLL